MENLLLGVARAVITPKIGANLAGYKPDNISTAVNDDLTATVFYFKQGEKEGLSNALSIGMIWLERANRA